MYHHWRGIGAAFYPAGADLAPHFRPGPGRRSRAGRNCFQDASHPGGLYLTGGSISCSLVPKLRLTLQMIREETPYLLRGTPEQVDRRFELLRRQNDERNLRMLTGIARTREPS